MITRLCKILLLASLPVISLAGEPSYTVDSADGGDARMDLGFFQEINAGAKLRRISWALNNSECPVELIKGAGLKPEFDSDKNLYTYIGKGEALARQNVQAIEVVYLTYDVFNGFVGASFGVEIIDFQEGKTFDLKRMGKFPTDWAEIHYFFQSFAYVSRVKLNSGQVWKEDFENVKAQVISLGLELPDETVQKAMRNE